MGDIIASATSNVESWRLTCIVVAETWKSDTRHVTGSVCNDRWVLVQIGCSYCLWNGAMSLLVWGWAYLTYHQTPLRFSQTRNTRS